jgi:hypothetical protein
MATFGTEDLATLMATLTTMARAIGTMQEAAAVASVAAATATANQSAANAWRPKKMLDAKHLRLKEFTGEVSGYDDWAFTFKRALNSVDELALSLLQEVDGETGEFDEEYFVSQSNIENTLVEKYSSELYDIISQYCSGEALAIVKTVDNFKGFTAWSRLKRKFHPKTMARAVRLVGQVMNPPKIKDLRDVEPEITKWEEKLKILSKEFGEKFSDIVKVGVITSVLPLSVQEHVYSTLGDDVNYVNVMERIKLLVSNKVSMMSGPTPMDLGAVEHQYWAYEDLEVVEEDVGAVGMHVQCLRCSGWGHLARECPTKGKGSPKAFGKGGIKDTFKGGPKGYSTQPSKGTGKGFKGNCFKCGKQGHRALDCRVRDANSVDEVEDDSEEAEIGGVWMIGAIDVELPFQKLKTRRKYVSISNKFGALAEEEEPLLTKHVWTNPVVRAVRFDHEGKGSSAMAGPRAAAAKSANNKSAATVSSDKSAATVSSAKVPSQNQVHIGSVESVGAVESQKMTRLSALDFHVADVKKPLASAVKVARAGNIVVLSKDGGYIQSQATGERMEVRIENDTFVFDVQFENGEQGTITLDSGAGCNVWPRGKMSHLPMRPKKSGMKMVAANGTEIANYGRKLIQFRGMESCLDFSGPV